MVTYHHRVKSGGRLTGLAIFGVFVLVAAIALIGAKEIGKPHIREAGKTVGYKYTPIKPEPWETAAPPPKTISVPSGSTVLFIGDSWTQGYGATDAYPGGWIPLVARPFGWTTKVDAIGGTGYDKQTTANGVAQAMLPRIQADVKYHPKLVVLQAGINDVDYVYNDPKYGQKVQAAISAAAKLYPAVVVIGPCDNGNINSDYLANIDGYEQTAAEIASVHYLSCDQEGWFDNQMLISEYIRDDIHHPNDLGYQYLALKITGDLRKFVDTSPAS